VTLKAAGSQTISVTDGTQKGQDTVTVAAGSFAQLGVTAPANSAAGAPFTVTVSALDAFGNVVPGYADKVHFSSTDATAILPADYTFTAADQGVHSFQVTLSLPGSQSVTVTDLTTGTSAGTAAVAVSTVAAFEVSAPASIAGGASFSITVTAVDAFGRPAPGYTGTVHFTSSDGSAVLPASYTFQPSDQGVHIFTGLSLGTPGSQTINVADAGNMFVTGSATIAVNGRAPGQSLLATGADAGGGPEVKVFNPVTGAVVLDFLAYSPFFTGGVRVAMGDINGDGVPDVITAPGQGGGPDIRIFDGRNGALIGEFLAYGPFFQGGVFVAVGDLNGTGHPEIITGPDQGGGPDVRVFDGTTHALVREFLAYGPFFVGGVRVAAGDVNGDGKADIITGAGPSGSPNVEVFSGADNAVLFNFDAYGPFFTGGVYVAAGDVNGDGHADIITGAGPTGGPNVQVFSGADGTLLQSFLALNSTFSGGVRVAAGNFTGSGNADIVAAAGPTGGPVVRVLDGGGAQAEIDAFFAYNQNFLGGVFVGGA
jgi:hypothetical protein